MWLVGSLKDPSPIYINDMRNAVKFSIVHPYADDTNLLYSINPLRTNGQIWPTKFDLSLKWYGTLLGVFFRKKRCTVLNLPEKHKISQKMFFHILHCQPELGLDYLLLFSHVVFGEKTFSSALLLQTALFKCLLPPLQISFKSIKYRAM